MEVQEFESALADLGWKQSDFCRKTGVERNTPSRWVNGKTPIPAWVAAYLDSMREIQRLYAKFVQV